MGFNRPWNFQCKFWVGPPANFKWPVLGKRKLVLGYWKCILFSITDYWLTVTIPWFVSNSFLEDSKIFLSMWLPFFVPRIFTLSDLLESQWTDCIPDSKAKVGKVKDGFLHFFYFWKNYMKKLDEHEMEPISYKISDFVWSGYHIFAAVLEVVVMVAFKILSRIELAVSKPRFDLMKY